VSELPTPQVAARLAEALLSPLGDRWAHTRAVAARARELADAVPSDARELLEVAAWWHDLGYATGLVQTGMHQIDGARFLEDMGYPNRLVALVAHHSAAECEAHERGLVCELGRWDREESAVADALWMADMTTGPRGESFEYSDRLNEITARYNADSIVGRAMTAAQPLIRGAIDRTKDRVTG
jgi:putative nucleotidyltransferase with HDIG domain